MHVIKKFAAAAIAVVAAISPAALSAQPMFSTPNRNPF